MPWSHLHFSSVVLAALMCKARSKESYVEANVIIQVDQGIGGRRDGEW